jgi:hypothetical protein
MIHKIRNLGRKKGVVIPPEKREQIARDQKRREKEKEREVKK